MEKEFITYNQSLVLRELGFNELCFAWYHSKEEFYLRVEGKNINSNLIKKTCTAPLYQQAFRWFREKHNLDSFIKAEWQSMVKVGYYFSANDYYSTQPSHLTYEEAESACLDKLIEIVKNK